MGTVEKRGNFGTVFGKLGRKIFVFLVILFGLIFLLQIIIVIEGERSSERVLGENSVLLSNILIGRIDNSLINRVEEISFFSRDEKLKDALIESNNQFLEMSLSGINLTEYIYQSDERWIASNDTNEFMQKLIDRGNEIGLSNFVESYKIEKGYRVFSEVFIANNYGVVAAESDRTSDYYQADEEWFIGAINSSDFWLGDIGYDSSSQTYSITISRKIMDDYGNVLGVVKVALNIKEILDIIDVYKNMQIKDRVDNDFFNFKLLNRNGRIIYSTSPFNLSEIYTDEFFSINESIPGAYHIINRGNQNGKIVTHVKSDDKYVDKYLGWILIGESSLDSFFASSYRMKSYFFFIFIVCVLIVIFLIVFFSNILVSNILRLSYVAKEIGAGNYYVRADIKTNDELQDLGDAFNRMARQLQEAKENLASKVVERTKELYAVQRDLEKRTIQADRAKVATLNILEDVEESKEKLDEAYKQLKALEKLKNEFLSFTSHELKTPLTPILIQAQMLQGGDLGKLSSEQKKSIDMIVRNMRNLNQLIGDVLDISIIQSANLKIFPIRANLEDIIRQVVANIQPLAKQKNIIINVKLPPIHSLLIDVRRIGQVVNNLLNNAIKFTPDNGTINIEVWENSDNVVVRINDTGIGIAPDKIQTLFQPFSQVVASYKLKQKGTGLGLAICKGIISAHKGKIGVESVVGKGSTFYFSLPRKWHFEGNK